MQQVKKPIGQDNRHLVKSLKNRFNYTTMILYVCPETDPSKILAYSVQLSREIQAFQDDLIKGKKVLGRILLHRNAFDPEGNVSDKPLFYMIICVAGRNGKRIVEKKFKGKNIIWNPISVVDKWYLPEESGVDQTFDTTEIKSGDETD